MAKNSRASNQSKKSASFTRKRHTGQAPPKSKPQKPKGSPDQEALPDIQQMIGESVGELLRRAMAQAVEGALQPSIPPRWVLLLREAQAHRSDEAIEALLSEMAKPS